MGVANNIIGVINYALFREGSLLIISFKLLREKTQKKN